MEALLERQPGAAGKRSPIARQLKSLELFAGAGGLGIGLHLAGFNPVNVVEWDEYCCQTLRENKFRGVGSVKNWNLTHGDVRDVDFSQYEGKLALVSGGPPCQPFSLGGKHLAFNDNRDMFPQAIRAIRQARPKAFIFENVKGLTRSAFRNYFEYIRLQLQHPEVARRKCDDWLDHLKMLERYHTGHTRQGLHYNLVTRVLNSASYGVPQKRERVFFVGFRSDLEVSWNFPSQSHSQEALHWEMQHGDYWERHKVPKRLQSETASMKKDDKPNTLAWRTVRDALVGLPDPEKEAEKAKAFLNHRQQAGARSYKGHTGSPIDEPAKTLKAGVHGVPGGENMLLKPDGSVRYFTVRESARLQTFPDDFVFQGSWSETMRQLGNAVPVDLAKIVGLSVSKQLRLTT
jgi:DNA (cytosine-5)-methyltransferase 1